MKLSFATVTLMILCQSLSRFQNSNAFALTEDANQYLSKHKMNSMSQKEINSHQYAKRKEQFDKKRLRRPKHRIREPIGESKFINLMTSTSNLHHNFNLHSNSHSNFKLQSKLNSNSGGILFINVMDFNATNDGTKDNSNAFQLAMNYASSIGGAIVYVPSGIYLFTLPIKIPPAVTLLGSYLSVPSHGMPNNIPTDGTCFYIEYGYNLDPMNTSNSFITIQEDSLLRGVVMYYPLQKCDGSIPTQYSPTIYMVGNNAAIEDVECLNCYSAIFAIAAHRHYIARIQGQPIYIGLYIDETYDIGRIEDVHFNPWYCNNHNYTRIQSLYGRSFVFGRSDWEYVFNTFSFAYAIGYHFIETSTGSMNGNFLGLGTDSANNASIKVDASQAPGLLITNGEFTAFYDSGWAPVSGAVPTQILVSSSNTGPVILNSCSFWGPTNSIATLYSTGTTIFKGCVFVQWDEFNNNGAPAIYANGGNLIVEGCTFAQAKQQLYIDDSTKKVIFTSNIIEGDLNVTMGKNVVSAFDNNL